MVSDEAPYKSALLDMQNSLSCVPYMLRTLGWEMLEPIWHMVNHESIYLDVYSLSESSYSAVVVDGKQAIWHDHLATFVGIDCFDLPDGRRRALIASAARIYARRGTIPAVMEHLQIVLGLRSDQITITADPKKNKIVVKLASSALPQKRIAEIIMKEHVPVLYTSVIESY